ncbi:hypothetical protein BC833DRAFT_649879 [Globomyces pollinis-pini]|nr:hypothetical protein BC833DRAFT_649879 [Globomyces pollinis-pini]
MGGHDPVYPKWVWTYYGGWNPNPKYAVRNGVFTGLLILGVTSIVFSTSAKNERRIFYPHGWIPSMLWADEFHNPDSVAQWKAQLAKEGREWIEPIPDWWPFKK